MIILPITADDSAALADVINRNGFAPTHKMSVYKNRRGKFKSVILWCKGDLGQCKIEPLFATDSTYNIIPMANMKIILEDQSAW